jgi:hypothetical protein
MRPVFGAWFIGLANRLLRELCPLRSSPDFTTVVRHDRIFTFTRRQARIVKRLWQAWQHGTPEVHQDFLLVDERRTKRIADLFTENDAWGVLIVPGKRAATFRLAE